MLVGPWVTGLLAAPGQGCERGAAPGLTLGAPHIFSSTSRVWPSQDQECGLSLEGCLPASSERCFLLLIKPLLQPDRGSEIQSVRCSQTAGRRVVSTGHTPLGGWVWPRPQQRGCPGPYVRHVPCGLGTGTLKGQSQGSTKAGQWRGLRSDPVRPRGAARRRR